MKPRFLLFTLIASIIVFGMQAQGQSKSNSKPQLKKTSNDNGNSKQGKSSFKDLRNGKIYKTVIIGTQTWMAENLALKIDSNCWVYDNDTSKVKRYGYLYNFNTAKTICPSGWHLPTDAEWSTLATYLGGRAVAGIKLKESGTANWDSPNTNASNETGFTALPGGVRMDGAYKLFGRCGRWWSATEVGGGWAWYNSMNSEYDLLDRNFYNTIDGYSVRCIKD